MSLLGRLTTILESANPFNSAYAETVELAALRSEVAALKEEVGLGIAAYPYQVDPDDHLYRRLSQATRELPAIVAERARLLSWTLYESNPLAHGIIETIKDYIVGKGFSITSADPDVQRIIDRHWSDSVNQWQTKQSDRVRDLSIYGEAVYVTYVNKANGNVRISSIDPQLVKQVYTDPDNPEVVHTLVVNPKRGVGASAASSDTDRYYRVIHMDEDPGSSTFNYMMGAKDTDRFRPPGSRRSYRYTGSCFYFTINSVTGAVRGRPDLMPVLDWLDAYDQILFNFVDRTLLMNCFVWDVTIKNANEGQITSWISKHGRVPKPGTINVHNENETWVAVTPTLGSADFDIQQKTLKSQILSFMSMPPHWFGEEPPRANTSGNGDATAIVRLSARQLLFTSFLRQILQYSIDQAIIAKDLPKPTAASNPTQADNKNPKYVFSIAAPEMSGRDLAGSATSMMNVVQALVIGINADVIDVPEAQRIFSIVAGEFGADINLDAMIKRMKDADILDDDGYPIIDTDILAPWGGGDPVGGNPGGLAGGKKTPAQQRGGVQPLNPSAKATTRAPAKTNPAPKNPVSINSKRKAESQSTPPIVFDPEYASIHALELDRLAMAADSDFDTDGNYLGTPEAAGG